MLILDGKKVSEFRRDELRTRLAQVNETGPKPKLVVVLVGEHAASEVYVRNKLKSASEVGMRSELKRLAENVLQAELERTIQDLVSDPDVDGILVQLPLPVHIVKRQVLDLIPAEKDVDGLSVHSAAGFWRQDAAVWPCTPWGVMQMLEYYQIPIAGQHAVVVGRSEIVGQPMAQLLLKQNATVTIAHSKTQDLETVVQSGQIVIAAAGRAEFLGRKHFQKGAIVVDVGIHRKEKKLVGDVRFAELEGWAQAASPVPGGVGPLTISSLLENTFTLFQARRGIRL